MKPLSGEKQSELEELTEKICQDHKARGMAVGITDPGGEFLYEHYYGWRDADRHLPVDRDTIFGMASVTKSMTALAIMQMQAKGILDINDAVCSLVPEFTNKNRKEKVRLSHLMSHCGGFFPLARIVVDRTAKAMGIEDLPENGLEYRSDFADEGVRLVAGRLDAQTLFTGLPGEHFSYCNDGFGLLSDIIRRHSGAGSYAAYVRENILNPLGMTRSNTGLIQNSLDENAAILYSRQKDGSWRADRDYENDAFVLPGGGSLKSTLGDMAKYTAMWLNDGRTADGTVILDAGLIHEMETPRAEVNPKNSYGYGLEITHEDGHTVMGHAGSLPGVSSQFLFCRQSKLGVIVLCNTMDVPVGAVAAATMRACLDIPLTAERAQSLRVWSDEEQSRLPGEYISAEGDSFVISREPGGELFLSSSTSGRGKKAPLLSIGPWQGIVQREFSDSYLTAFQNKEGKVYGARFGSRIFPKVK